MRKNGFTLIELLVVIAIIAVLASIALPVFNGVQERARAAQDMSNLRQIGLATQMYMNDNDGTIFSTSGGTWMSQLEPKYLPTWKIFASPFDKRSTSETGDATTAVSYGANGNSKISGGNGILGMLSDKITNPSAFILFAPAQSRAATVTFTGTAAQGAPGVTVYKGLSVPGGNYGSASPGHGTHSGRTRINAVFADMHTETVPWSTFINDTTSTTDPTAGQRWDP